MSTDGPAALLPVDEHLADVLGTIRPLRPVTVPLEAAEGGVLAADVTASTPLPSFDNSAMDGYAVRAADVAAATEDDPVRLPVRGEIAAGDTGSYRVEPGSCLRIMTGALMPAGADAVVPVEWTDDGSAVAAFRRAVPVGNALRLRGDDVAIGATLLTAGTPVGSVQLALLAAAGQGEVLVRPRPRVAVIVHRKRARRAGHPAGARPDLGVEQLHAGRGGAGRRARWRTPAPAAAMTRTPCSARWRRCCPRPTC